MSICKVNENKYIVRVNITLSPRHYKRINKVAFSYKEAKRIEQKLQAYKKMNGEMLFGDAVELYLDDHEKRWKKTSYENAKHMIYSRILPNFKDIPLNRITPSDIHSWQLRLIRDNLAPYFIYTLEKHFKNIFTYAVNYLNLAASPFKNIKHMGKECTREMNFWTLNEFKEILTIIPEEPIVDFEFKIILYVAFLCGLRMGEILALSRKDINFSKNTISITKTYSVVLGGEYIGPAKTKNAVRVITMPQFLAKRLKDYIQRQTYQCKEERIFKDYKPEKLRSKLNKYIKVAGVKKIRFHDLRHSAVSYWIHLGIPIYDISRRCGHASPKETYNVYAHMYPEGADHVADLLQQNKEKWDKGLVNKSWQEDGSKSK